MVYSRQKGFTLVELMVVIAIIGILSTIVYANFGSSKAVARDAQRKADLQNLQSAIERYKLKYGRYPKMGCNADTIKPVILSESECPVYIDDLAPEFIDKLPTDKYRNAKKGYSYITNKEGTVYKIMALNTVESEKLDYTNTIGDMKAYDIRVSDETGSGGSRDVNGWCFQFIDPNPDENSSLVDFYSNPNGVEDNLKNSYALWAGYAEDSSAASKTDFNKVQGTTNIICQ